MKELTVKSLVWDKWNREHIKRHNLTPRQAETVFHDPNRLIEKTHSDRFKVIGKAGKRMLTLILSAIGKKFYIVTARDADQKERDFYRKYNQQNEYEKT